MRWAVHVVIGIWAALGVLAGAPRFGEAADATVTATGRFVYQKYIGTQLVEIGIKGARVEMCDDDGVFGCQLMAVGQTDDDGNFSVTGTAGDFFGDLPDPLVKVIAQSEAATIEDAHVFGGVYCFRSDVRSDRPNGSTIDFGTISTGTGFGCAVGGDVDLQSEAWDLHNLALEARDFMQAFTLVTPGRDVPPVKVRWPADQTKYDRPDAFSPNGTISVDNIGPIEPYFMKQYGHHVLQHFADNPVGNFNNGICDAQVDPFGIETGRCRWQAENGAIHWTEGFPIFLGHVLSRFWGYGDNLAFYLGAGPHPHPDQNFHLVPEVTATILYNLLGSVTALGRTVAMDPDGNNHDANHSRDNVSVGFETIWDAIVNFDPAPGDPAHNHPQTIQEFWTAFASLHPDLANRLSEVYDESHITWMPAADLQVTAVVGSTSVVFPGGSLTIADTTANGGGVSTADGSTTRIYLSTDNAITVADTLLGSRSVPTLGAGASHAGTTAVVIPANLPLGNYYLGACADAPGVLFEANELNNCRASTTTIQVREAPAVPGGPTGLAQLKTDLATVLPVGAWSKQTTVVLRFTMTDANRSDTLVPEVEIKPVGTAFNGSGLRAGSPVASTGAPVLGSVTATGLSNGAKYHWRARVKDAGGQVSGWVSFGGNGETAMDFGVDTAAPSGTIKIDNGAAWTDAPAVTLKLTCSDTKSGCVTMELSNDNFTFTAPEPFAATRAWVLPPGDSKKTVYVRYIDGAGNVSKAFLDTITLDTAAPFVGLITPIPHAFTPSLGETTTIRMPVFDVPSGSCSLKIDIRNAGGQVVRSFSKTALCSPAGVFTSVVWDGRSASRALVPAGSYLIEVTATDQAGNVGPVIREPVVVQ